MDRPSCGSQVLCAQLPGPEARTAGTTRAVSPVPPPRWVPARPPLRSDVRPSLGLGGGVFELWMPCWLWSERDGRRSVSPCRHHSATTLPSASMLLTVLSSARTWNCTVFVSVTYLTETCVLKVVRFVAQVRISFYLDD